MQKVQLEGGIHVPECYVTFDTIDDVRDFVSIATRYRYRIQVSRENHFASATSIMGLFCMGLHTTLRVTVLDQSADPTSFFNELRPYAVA